VVIAVRSTASVASTAEVEAVRDRAALALPRLLGILGLRPSQLPVAIRLAGDGGSGRYSTVDPNSGEVILYRFVGDGGGYEASLVHELVHALRRHRWTDPQRQTDPALFLEEGLAEVVAVEVGFPSTGFPLYGASLDVAAGQWIDRGEDLDPADLVRRHNALNFSCMPQAYTLRLSFITYLRERFGLASLVALAEAPPPLDEDAFVQAFEVSLDELSTAWRAWATTRYAAASDASSQARAYRDAVKYFPVCARDGTPAIFSPSSDTVDGAE
jgi:hypothetical protein